MKFYEVVWHGTFSRTRIVPVPDDFDEENGDIYDLAWENGEEYDTYEDIDDSEYREIEVDNKYQLHLHTWLKRKFPKQYEKFIAGPTTELSKFINNIYVKEKEKMK